MALGNNSVGNKSDKKTSSTELTVYSSISMMNSESEVDKTSLSFLFWNGLMAIQISQLVEDRGIMKKDKDNNVSIYLSIPKALMLSKQIEDFINGDIDFAGINTRSGCIAIQHGCENGRYKTDSPAVIIRKIDEKGNIDCAYAYIIRDDYHFALKSLEEDDGRLGEYEKKTYNYVELELIKMQLDEYVKAMTNAEAYAVCNQNFKRDNRLEFKVNKIAEALGVSTSSYENNGGYSTKKKSTGSYFSNGGSNLASDDSDFE